MKPRPTTANGSGSDPSTTANAASGSLRLWLPGYHTPSLNRTAGQHWSKARRLKKGAAAALYEAMDGCWRLEAGFSKPVMAEARRVLSKLLLGVPVEKRRGKKPPVPERPAYVRVERVTTSLLDEDNFKGGAKGLLDCLRAAFPTILLDDAPGYLVGEYVQTVCAKKCEEGTWVWLAAARPMLDAGGSMLDGRRPVAVSKPTVITADPRKLAEVYAKQGTQSHADAVRSIRVQNGLETTD